MNEQLIGQGFFHLEKDDEIWGFDRRWTVFSNVVWVNITDRLIDLLGPVAKRQIYEVGFSSGLLAGQKIRPHFGGGFEQFKSHVNLSHAMGWGAYTFMEYNEESSEIVMESPNMWEAEGYRELHPKETSSFPRCLMSAGIAAGAAQAAMDISYECEEELCISKGDRTCRFILNPSGDAKKVIR